MKRCHWKYSRYAQRKPFPQSLIQNKLSIITEELLKKTEVKNICLNM